MFIFRIGYNSLNILNGFIKLLCEDRNPRPFHGQSDAMGFDLVFVVGDGHEAYHKKYIENHDCLQKQLLVLSLT